MNSQEKSYMSRVEIDNINVKTTQSALNEPIILDLTFTALQPLPQPLNFRATYVGSAFSELHDQILEEVEIEKIEEPSTMQFELECSPPDFSRLPRDQLICTTALILSVDYMGQEFIRVGYYIHNAFKGEEDHNQLPLEAVISNSERTVIDKKPRITKFEIDWTGTKKIEGEEEKESRQESVEMSKEEKKALKMGEKELESYDKLDKFLRFGQRGGNSRNEPNSQDKTEQ